VFNLQAKQLFTASFHQIALLLVFIEIKTTACHHKISTFLFLRGLLRHVLLWAYGPAEKYITIGSLHFIANLVFVDGPNKHRMTLSCGREY
jgi:hypothetical protein